MAVCQEVNTKEWDNNYSALSGYRIGKFFKNNAIKAARFNEIVKDKGLRILDVGCGSGKFLESLLESGFVNLSGIEPDPELTKGISDRIKIINCPAERILFDNNSFDVVFIYGVLHHLKGKEAWAQSFNEIDRVLRPGGHLFILEPCSPFVYRTLQLSAGLFGLMSSAARMLGDVIREESPELYDFMKNYRTYERFIQEKKYSVIVNRRTIFLSPIVQWILTARKP